MTTNLLGLDLPHTVQQPRCSHELFAPAIQAHYQRGGVFGLAEAYLKGEWASNRLDELMYAVFAFAPKSHLRYPWGEMLRYAVRQTVFNPQSGRSAFNIGTRHYDLGNDLFSCMLDSSMTYTCGYWKEATDLNAAQLAKLEMVCRKLELQEGMRILDIGCGWGNFAEYAARNHGVSVTGLTVSVEQAALAQDRCRGLPVEILLQDYRDINRQFDRVVSLEMIEAVGRKNLPVFFRVVNHCLKDDGLFLLQVISADTLSRTSDPALNQFLFWILKYIFPDGYLPTSTQLTTAERQGFIIEDWHGFGPDYDKTLMKWAENFNASWPELAGRYGEDFKRRWNFYLYSCAAVFRARLVQLYQIVYSKGGLNSYRSRR